MPGLNFCYTKSFSWILLKALQVVRWLQRRGGAKFSIDPKCESGRKSRGEADSNILEWWTNLVTTTVTSIHIGTSMM